LRAGVAPRERASVLRRAAGGLRERVETFAMLCTPEMGKPLAEARAEVELAAEYLGRGCRRACSGSW